MFLGQHSVIVNEDNILTLPEQFTDNLSETSFLTQGFDRNLLIFTETAFHELYNCMTAMNIANPIARLLLRILLGNAIQLVKDEKGNIQIPAQLRTFVELEKNGVIVGQGEYFEIWAQTHWERQVIEINDANSNSQRFASLNMVCQFS